ncbi:YdcH family protein [Primorskyibacter sp. 2E233]|uniref:YdcH family protein n=1 Tax=Primorskyibacter sp. 2E233 TaxID=3413431 RepID=UPI003BF43BAF
MKKTSAEKLHSIKARVANLHRRRHDLAMRIDEELQRPAPCSVALQHLKRQRLRLKDQITHYNALLRSPDRSRFPVQAV